MSPAPHDLPYVCFIRTADRDDLLATLDEWGFHTVVLDGSAVTSAEALFAAVGEQVDLGYGLPPKGWDGLRDSFFEIGVVGATPLVAFVWDHADVLAAADLQDLQEVVSVFESAATSILGAQEIHLHAFLLGESSAFRPLSSLLP